MSYFFCGGLFCFLVLTSIGAEGLFVMAGKLPVLKPKRVMKALERGGFHVHHATGSHYILKKDILRVTVPYHNKDLKPGTLRSIIEQAGLTVEEFLKLT
jgi:predicted RNA binding protein YcfA (HicA-like mRNA interferase family)